MLTLRSLLLAFWQVLPCSIQFHEHINNDKSHTILFTGESKRERTTHRPTVYTPSNHIHIIPGNKNPRAIIINTHKVTSRRRRLTGESHSCLPLLGFTPKQAPDNMSHPKTFLVLFPPFSAASSTQFELT